MSATSARAAGAGIAMALLVGLSGRASAYCPSYTPAQTAGGVRCGIEPALGHNPTTAEWSAIFGRVCGGKARWGADGPNISKLGAGCGKPKPETMVDARFPSHVLKAIAMQESGWTQFCVPDAPAASKGSPERTIVSFDCGYGIGQVTSGMHVGEAPDFDRARVAADATYNLATGTRILRDKWAATSCVGDADPDVVEDWYTAMWAYNGLSYSNNPNNPNLKAGRGPYDPKNGGAYTYQERVLGWMEHPPSAAHWPKLEPAYPNRGEIGDGSRPGDLSEPSCASPTSCATTRPTHRSTCDAVAPIESDAGVVDGSAEAGVAPQPAPFVPAPGGASPAAGAPPAAAPPSEAEPDGCACRATGAGGDSPSAPIAVVALATLALARAARRRTGAARADVSPGRASRRSAPR